MHSQGKNGFYLQHFCLIVLQNYLGNISQITRYRCMGCSFPTVCAFYPAFVRVRHNSRIESWLGVFKEQFAKYYVPKSSITLPGTDVWKISSVACGFSSIKIDYPGYPKSLISRIYEVYGVFFSIKYRYSDILLKKT